MTQEVDKSLDLSSFGNNLNVVVFGASGGLGSAIVQLFNQSANVNKIYAFSRSTPQTTDAKVQYQRFDLLDEETIEQAADIIDEPVDIVFVATGLLHKALNEEAGLRPEKSWRAFEPQAAQMIYQINAIGPMLIAKHFLPKLASNKKSVFAAISARVGSISDNKIGGWYSYRASKAALNQMIRTASVELQRKKPQALCVGLHPGTVDTGLSKPFQGNVPNGKLFEPHMSARAMLHVLNGLQPAQSGHQFAWDGQMITP